MKSSAPIVLMLATSLLAGCSPGSNPESDAQKPKISPEDQALLNSVKKPLDEARQVEQQIMDAAAAQRKQIDEQSQ